MIIQPLPNFGVNGLAKGGLIALDDDGKEPLGWEANGNWSSGDFLDKEVKRLSAQTGITLERSRAVLTQALIQARREMGVPGQEDKPEPSIPPTRTPPVSVSNRFMREIVDQTWNEVQKESEPPRFFRFSGTVCDLIERDVKDNTGSISKLLGTRVLSNTAFAERLDRLVDFIKFDDEGRASRARPPKDVVESMLVQPDSPLLPLQGIARGPVCAPDGTIVMREGYDPQTQMYVAMGTLKVPPVPDSPSDDDIARALQLLLGEVLVDFPFVSDADLAHAVSLFLTPVAREMITGPTPLHGVEAPTPGSGKDLLVDAASYTVTGSPIAAMSEGRDDDEWRKRIFAKLLESPAFVLLDNVKRRLDSGALSAALERPIIEDRFLGQSHIVSVPVTCTWVATGNNPVYSDEIARRTARIRIDTGLEDPAGQRKPEDFRHPDLIGWVKGNRGELLWAILTLIRAWVSRGRPPGKGVMGSYTGWVSTVGGILEVAGIPGFLGNRDEVYAQARAQNEGMRALVAAWWAAYRTTVDGEETGFTRRVGTDELFALAKEMRLLSDLRDGRTDQGARVVLGMELAAMRDRVVGNWRIRYAGTRTGGGQTWNLEKI